MYTIKFTGVFKRQMKLCERRGSTGYSSGNNTIRN